MSEGGGGGERENCVHCVCVIAAACVYVVVLPNVSFTRISLSSLASSGASSLARNLWACKYLN